MNDIKVVQIGVGPIGAEPVKYALQKQVVGVIGAVDIDKNKIGKDIGDHTIGRKVGVPITDDAEALFKRTKLGVGLHSTGSYLNDTTRCMRRRDPNNRPHYPRPREFEKLCAQIYAS